MGVHGSVFIHCQANDLPRALQCTRRVFIAAPLLLRFAFFFFPLRSLRLLRERGRSVRVMSTPPRQQPLTCTYAQPFFLALAEASHVPVPCLLQRDVVELRLKVAI